MNIPKLIVTPLLALGALLGAILLLFAFNLQQAQGELKDLDAAGAVRQRQIETNTTKLATVVHDQCESRNAAAAGTNDVLDTLIVAVRSTKSLPEAEKIDRAVRYTTAKVPVIDCSTTGK